MLVLFFPDVAEFLGIFPDPVHKLHRPLCDTRESLSQSLGTSETYFSLNIHDVQHEFHDNIISISRAPKSGTF